MHVAIFAAFNKLHHVNSQCGPPIVILSEMDSGCDARMARRGETVDLLDQLCSERFWYKHLTGGTAGWNWVLCVVLFNLCVDVPLDRSND